jgi:hypothetical protein
MGALTIIFWILFALWCIALGVWLYTIINRRMREDFVYVYPLIAVIVLNVAMQVILHS